MSDTLVTAPVASEPIVVTEGTSAEVKIENTVQEASGRSGDNRTQSESSEGEPTSPDIVFKPIVSLPLVETKTLEEDEEDILKLRAKLYRYVVTEDEAPEWKERGVGEVKLLKHRVTGSVRLLMRRDKTLKVCANHYITPVMELKKHSNSDKAFVWSTLSDFADEEPKKETLCIRFGTPENGAKFQSAFDEARKIAALSTGLGDLSFGHDDEDDDDTTTASEDENEDSPVKKVETESAQSTQGTEDSTQAELQSPTEPNVDPLVDQNKSSPIKVNPDDTPAANDSTPAQEFNGSTQDDVETRDDSNKPPLTE